MKRTTRTVSLVMTAIIMLFALTAECFAAGIGFENASSVKSGKKYSASIAEGESAYFIITVSKTGKFRLALNCGIAQANITLLNADETSIQPSDYSSASGAAWWVDRTGSAQSGTQGNAQGSAQASAVNGFSTLYWDHDDKAYNGTLTYEVSKGVYYIKMENYRNGGEAGTVTFSPSFPSASAAAADISGNSAIKAMAVSVNKGTALQLGVSVKSAKGVTIKWSSSDSSIVSVTSKGRITARKKGVAVITATVGDSKGKLVIQVV